MDCFISNSQPASSLIVPVMLKYVQGFINFIIVLGFNQIRLLRSSLGNILFKKNLRNINSLEIFLKINKKRNSGY